MFCQTLSKSDKRTYALPTEAQWEYACRAGTDTPFSFGATVATRQANYDKNHAFGQGKSSKSEYTPKPLPVGKTRHNAWGLYDMHGNISEWCADTPGPYSSQPQSDPKGPPAGKARVVRGGTWRSTPGSCRSASRAGSDKGAPDIGFRVICTIPAK